MSNFANDAMTQSWRTLLIHDGSADIISIKEICSGGNIEMEFDSEFMEGVQLERVKVLVGDLQFVELIKYLISKNLL